MEKDGVLKRPNFIHLLNGHFWVHLVFILINFKEFKGFYIHR